MTHVATVSSKFQISLPKSLRERLGLRPGDHLVVEECEGNLILTPAATVPKGQLYFWSRRWQEGELRAEEDIRAGRLSRTYAPAETEGLVSDILKVPEVKRRRQKKS